MHRTRKDYRREVKRNKTNILPFLYLGIIGAIGQIILFFFTKQVELISASLVILILFIADTCLASFLDQVFITPKEGKNEQKNK